MKQRFREDQIVHILREGEAAETKAEVWRTYGISAWTYYCWRQRYGGLAESQAKRLKPLEQEIARLKRLVAEQALAQEALQEALEKKGRLWWRSGRW